MLRDTAVCVRTAAPETVRRAEPRSAARHRLGPRKWSAGGLSCSARVANTEAAWPVAACVWRPGTARCAEGGDCAQQLGGSRGGGPSCAGPGGGDAGPPQVAQGSVALPGSCPTPPNTPLCPGGVPCGPPRAAGTIRLRVCEALRFDPSAVTGVCIIFLFPVERADAARLSWGGHCPLHGRGEGTRGKAVSHC